MPSVRFNLHLSRETYLLYYQGVARRVVVTAEDGRVIEFPADVLRQVVGHDGVHGRFELVFDASNRFQGIRRV